MLKSSFTPDKIEAGCDEAGRGSLAGPVVAAAVVLPKDYKNTELNDSKVLSVKQREKLRTEIEREAVTWSIAELSNHQIDKLNILNASFKAMNQAIRGLSTRPDLLLIDGNRFYPEDETPYECVVKGDGIYLSIAAASVLAKTFRDEYMWKLSEEFPGYGWESNVGYASKEHRDAIKEIGITPHHRRSFLWSMSQLELFD